MNISIDRNLRTPLFWQIFDQIKELIINGSLPDGSALPSERTQARILGVHRNTIIKAYSLLKDADLIDSVQGVGYVVTYREETAEAKDGKETGSGRSKKRGSGMVNWATLIKDEYQDMEQSYDNIFSRFTEEKGISLSTGMPPAIYDEDELAANIASILSAEGRRPFFITPYQGDVVLRQQIVSYLRTKGIKAGVGDVQILSETNQALDFIVAALLNPGDTVILEEPVSPDVYRVIELAGCKPVTVPVDEDGMMCDHIEPLIESAKPKFIYVNSSYQDPTGYILSIERRRKLLELSNKYRIPIIEDDAASELSFEDRILPTLKSMEDSGNVIYIYSFALTFIPGMSMAFVVGPKVLIKALNYLVSIRVMSLDWMTQKLIAEYISDGSYYDRVRDMAALNREKMSIVCDALDELADIGLTYKRPRGGVYVWCRLPDGVDSQDVVSEAFKRGVMVIPGETFYPFKNAGQNFIRLNYSYEPAERIRRGMDILTEVIKSLAADSAAR